MPPHRFRVRYILFFWNSYAVLNQVRASGMFIVDGLSSEIALRNTRSKGTVYTGHQSKN